MAIEKNYKAKVSSRNKVFLEKIKSFAQKYSIVGIVDVTSLPAPQFQRIRASIKKISEVLIVKRSLIEIGLKDFEKKFPGISAMTGKLGGVVGLIFTNENPFSLYKFIKKNKSSAPAKPGAVAPNDIVVPAGPTSFAPGPIIGELGALKIKAGISAGKVEIKEDCVVAKEGDVVSDKLAGVLSRLGIEPMEVGLNIKCIYEGGTVYGRDILDVDEEAILNNLKEEAARCFGLSVGLGYVTRENVGLIIGKAQRDALGLGLGIEYPAAETIKSLLMKASAQGAGVALASGQVKPAGSVSEDAKPVAAGESSAVNEGSDKKKEETDVGAAFGSFF